MSAKAEAVMLLKKGVKHSVVYEDTTFETICRSVYLTRIGLAKAGIDPDKVKAIKVTIEAVE